MAAGKNQVTVSSTNRIVQDEEENTNLQSGFDLNWGFGGIRFIVSSSPFNSVLYIFIIFVFVFLTLAIFINPLFSIVLLVGVPYMLYFVIKIFNKYPLKLASDRHIEFIQQILLGDKKTGLQPPEDDGLYLPGEMKNSPKKNKKKQ